MENQIIIEELSFEKVVEMTEAQIAEIIDNIEKESDKEKRTKMMKIVDTTFEIRTISSKNRNLRADLAFFGYKFFPLETNKIYLRGIRRKANKD